MHLQKTDHFKRLPNALREQRPFQMYADEFARELGTSRATYPKTLCLADFITWRAAVSGFVDSPLRAKSSYKFVYSIQVCWWSNRCKCYSSTKAIDSEQVSLVSYRSRHWSPSVMILHVQFSCSSSFSSISSKRFHVCFNILKKCRYCIMMEGAKSCVGDVKIRFIDSPTRLAWELCPAMHGLFLVKWRYGQYGLRILGPCHRRAMKHSIYPRTSRPSAIIKFLKYSI